MKAKILIIILLLIFIMTGIVHERIVASRDKGLAVDWNANHQITGNVDMGQYSWLNQVIENRTDWPAGPIEGQVVWRSDLDGFYVYNGTDWVIFIDEDNINNYIGIAKGTHYWSCPGVNFVADNYHTEYVTYHKITGMLIVSTLLGTAVLCPVTGLPNGAVITGAKVFGNAATNDETWTLERTHLSTAGGNPMAGANINTEDVTINNPTIDNSNYGYWFVTSVLSQNDQIWGARITYTL